MKYTILIDQAKSIEWGLSLSEAAMFAFAQYGPTASKVGVMFVFTTIVMV